MQWTKDNDATPMVCFSQTKKEKGKTSTLTNPQDQIGY